MVNRSKITYLSALLLILVLSLTAVKNARSFNDISDETRIKAVIKQAFITESKAYGEIVEYNNESFPGKRRIEAFEELAEYVNNKKGYLDHLKDLSGPKAVNEKLFFAKSSKWRFKEFDFKFVTIEGTTATVEMNIYAEVTTRIGGQISTFTKRDQYDNVISVETGESEPYDIVTPGGFKHFITLELIGNKWQIVWDDWTYLPEYRP